MDEWKHSWVASAFWLLWIMLLSTWVYKYIFETLLSVLFSTFSKMELLYYMVILYLIIYFFEEPPQSGCTILCSFKEYTGVPVSAHPPQYLLFYGFVVLVKWIFFSFLIMSIGHLIVVSVCISLMISVLRAAFLVLSGHLHTVLKSSYSSPLSIFLKFCFIDYAITVVLIFLLLPRLHPAPRIPSGDPLHHCSWPWVMRISSWLLHFLYCTFFIF